MEEAGCEVKARVAPGVKSSGVPEPCRYRPVWSASARVGVSESPAPITVTGRRLAEPPHVAKHVIQALAGDALHGVVEDPLVLAEVEDLHDVRVVQPRRRAGLVAEPSPVGQRVTTPRVQDFQGHVRR